MEGWNPHSSDQTSIAPNPYRIDDTALLLDPKDLAKAEAVIKDSYQFWLALLMLFICNFVGCFFIVPWCLIRLSQWNALAKKYPGLLGENPPSASLAQRFQSSKGKLLVTIGVGTLLLSVLALLFIGGLFNTA